MEYKSRSTDSLGESGLGGGASIVVVCNAACALVTALVDDDVPLGADEFSGDAIGEG